MFGLLVLRRGIAGLTTALHAARAGMSVLVVTKGELSHSATRYAQGGVAAALAEPDSPELHLADTLTAGAGLCDLEAVRALRHAGRRAPPCPRRWSLARARRACGRRRHRCRDRTRARRGSAELGH